MLEKSPAPAESVRVVAPAAGAVALSLVFFACGGLSHGTDWQPVGR